MTTDEDDEEGVEFIYKRYLRSRMALTLIRPIKPTGRIASVLLCKARCRPDKTQEAPLSGNVRTQLF